MRTSLPDGEAVPAESADLACLACPFRAGCQMKRERAPERRGGRKSQAQNGGVLFWDEKGEVPLAKSGANALLAIKCRMANNRWAEFLYWRACRAAVRPKMGRAREKIAFPDHSPHQDFFRSLGSLIVKMVPVCPGPSLRCLVLYSMLPLCMRMLNSESLIPMR